ncbi:MAG: hypothetical protein JXA99_11765, partial [Candidatus Lokiarchaeota archaeon]|nr:hypothetical protein [Candidatus Lokiarchaeota archaeon]
IVQAFEDDNIPYIQYQEVLTIDMGKLMGTWRCLECFWLNSRDQSDCDRCGYHNKEIEEEIKRRKEQNWKETVKEIFLMLKNNDEAVDLFNGRIYINPERLVNKEDKYYIQDDNMNYVCIDKISEDIYGYYVLFDKAAVDEYRLLNYYNSCDGLLCRGKGHIKGKLTGKNDENEKTIKAEANIGYSSDKGKNDNDFDYSVDANASTSVNDKGKFETEVSIEGKIEF